MNAMTWMLKNRRLVLTVALLLSLSGAVLWLTMIRQEDPRLPDFWGQVVAPYPGADAPTVERLVLEPIEDALAQVNEIKFVEATAFDEMTVMRIELRGDISDFDKAWDKVRDALEKARLDFPEGAGPAVLDENQVDQDAIVLAVTGSSDDMALLEGARKLKDHLLRQAMVKRVHLIADPGEQVTIALDDAASRRLGLNARQVATLLHARNRILSGGSLHLADQTVRLRPLSEFASLAEIRKTPLPLSGGGSVPLEEVGRVHLGPREPAAARMRLNGAMAVGVAVVPRQEINLVRFGAVVRQAVQALAPQLAPLHIQTVTFQPDRTQARLQDLNRSLLFGVLIVAGILILAMGLRLGLVVAAVVPLVVMTAVALFAWGGGVLHQISISALVLALGMLVDNAIVVAENVQWRLEQGQKAGPAALGAVQELATPLAAATLTTLAAFVPMLIAGGPTAAFTRSIPVVIMLTLGVSYLYALFVTPVLSQMALRPGTSRSTSLFEGLGRRLAGLAVGRPRAVLLGAGGLLLLSLLLASQVRQQFFPSADRNQVLIDVKLAEGTHLDATDQAVREVEQALLQRPEVTRVSSFMGRSAPAFYYNVPRVPFSPHFAQLIVQTRDVDDIAPLLEYMRQRVVPGLPQAEVVTRKLEQGPPVQAPVEVRLSGQDLNHLNQAAIAVSGALKIIPGTRDIRHDLGPGAPTLRFSIDDAVAGRYAASRSDVAQAIYGRTRGLPVGQLYSGEDPIAVVVRSAAGEQMAVSDLLAVDVSTRDGGVVPLAQVAHVQPVWQPAAIKHRNGLRVVTVSSQLQEGYTFTPILNALKPKLGSLDMPPDVTVSFGGDAEGSGEANSELLRSLPMGLLLLLGVLLAEFNSFRRVAMVLATVPLAAAGVIPGLVLGRQPFGFMSMLGVIALVGIVVNNAIVLLEVVEARRREGADIPTALRDAVTRRIRPILLTSATTVAGLLPLAVSSSTLWPPLASAMISGLIASTALTLVVVPALYRVLMQPASPKLARWFKRTATAAVLVAMGLAWHAPAQAQAPLQLSLEAAMRLAQQRPLVDSARQRQQAAAEAAATVRRSALWPQLNASADWRTRDRDLALRTPAGDFPLGKREAGSAALLLSQPLFDPARLLYALPAAQAQAQARQFEAQRIKQEAAAAAAAAHLEVLSVDGRLQATDAYVRSLSARLGEIQAMTDAGRALESDTLKIRLALDQARLDLERLKRRHGVALQALALAVNYEGPLEVLPVNGEQKNEVPLYAAVYVTALERRPDLKALQSSVAALEKSRAAVKAEMLPRLDAGAAWIWDQGAGYADESWVEGRVTVTWTPFAAGTRHTRSAELAARKRALEAELREARRQVGVELHGVLADLETARLSVKVEAGGVQQAQATLEVEQARHLAGRATTNDLLEAEAQLRNRQTAYALARLDVVRAWVRLWLAAGQLTPEAMSSM